MFPNDDEWRALLEAEARGCDHRFEAFETLVHWFLNHRNFRSYQDLVEQFLMEFRVIRR